MKILLVTKQPFIKKESKVYCSFAVSSTLKHFERNGELYICPHEFNGKSSQPIDVLTDIPGERVEFLLNESSIKRRYLDRSYNRNILDTWVQKVDLVIGYNPATIGDLALEYAKKHGKAYMAFLVSCIWDGTWHHRNWKARIMAPIFFCETKQTIMNSDYVWYVTEKFLQERYPTQGLSLGYTDTNIGIAEDRTLENRLEKIRQMAIGHNGSPRELSLLTVGHLDVGFKGQKFVIKALPELNKSGIKCIYYMIGAGDGSYLVKLAKELGVSEQVVFLGRKTRNEVLDYMDKTDIYLQPSLQEGLPRSVAEAMSRAMPCIGSKTGGIPEMLDDRFITRRKSVSDIVNIISSMTIENLKEQATKNFNKAKDYQPDEIAKKVDDFFEMIRKDILK